MRRLAEIRRLDPVDPSEVERVSSRFPFDDLGRAIVAGQTDAGGSSSEVEVAATRLHGSLRRRRPAALVGAAAVAVLVAGVLLAVQGGGGLTAPLRTPWHAARPFSASRGAGHHRAGTWRLVDALLTGTWQQNTSGPPPGYLACPDASTCYVMSGHYPSALGGAPLLSESLYVTTDLGTTWSALPMPSGFAPTSPLACASATACAAGGTYRGQPVLLTTGDGGHSFTIDPLPAGDGTLYTLTCPAAGSCAGLAATATTGGNPPPGLPVGATFLSTDDGGATFSDSPILAGDSMQVLTCSTAVDCTAVGGSDAPGGNDLTSGVVAVTTDGGQSWTVGTLPAGFGVGVYPELACADAVHCTLSGFVSKGSQLSGQLASTTDGGLTWTLDPLPADVVEPFITGVACPTDDECWVSGSENVPQKIGNVTDGSSSMLLGTTDGGTTWSTVTFSVPNGAPNYDGQSYLSLGSIDCPTSGACVALGATAQGSPTAPVYSLVVPGSA